MSSESHPTEEAWRRKRLALVVGVDHAPNSHLPPLRSARKDAEAVAQALTQHCQFTLLEPPLLDERATSSAVKRALLHLAQKRTSDDFLLFYFSGHGIPMDVEAGRKAVYLGTFDFTEEEVEADENFHLSLSWLCEKLYLQTEAGKVVLILDACYSGNMGRTLPDPYLQELQERISHYFDAPGEQSGAPSGGLRQALTATGHNLPAPEGPDHGHMTGLLLPALRGEVLDILGRQGQLALKRLSAYLDEQYEQRGLRLPSLSGDSAGQQCILASFPVSESRLMAPLAASGHPDRPVTYLPFPRNPHFQPRPGEFVALEQLLFAAGSAPVHLGLVGVTGMGGVGKTQLAIEVAYRYQQHFPDGIFWMPATGQDLFAWQQTLAELARKTDYLPPGDDPTHPDAQLRRARHLCRYFATHANALLILDNVEVPVLVSTALPELAGEALACCILYTSRKPTPPAGATSYAVTPLSQEGALRLLLESTRPALLAEVLAGSQSQEAQAARTLCQQTDGLPLALTHLQGLLAEDRHMHMQDLLAALLQHGILTLARAQDNQLPTLSETFSLSWQQVGEGQARECFLLASLFPEAVPIPLWLLGLASGLGERARPFDPLWEVCLRLQELSLLELLSGEQVRLHPLVRAFGEQEIQRAGERGRTLCRRAVERLTAIFCDLSLLEQRARQLGYLTCLSQLRLARDYARNLDPSHADQLIDLERAMDRESYLLADTGRWPETLPCLFYQQLFNRAVETGPALPKQKPPSCWIEQMRPAGTTDRSLLRILSGHTDAVSSVAFSPDGRQVVTGSGDNTARMWESSTGKPVTTLQGHTNPVNSVAFSPDGRLVLTGSYDGTAWLWESSTGKPLATLQGHTDIVNSMAFSPDGRLVLTSDDNGWTFFWDIERIDKPQFLGLSVTADRVSSLFWQDTTHLLLADVGSRSGRPGVYRLHLQGPCWLPRG